MSAENVELTRLGYERFLETGDPTGQLMAPGFVWDMSTFRNWPERQTFDMTLAMVWSYKNGKQTRMRMYTDPDEARRAAGVGD